jgi:ribonuclease HII
MSPRASNLRGVAGIDEAGRGPMIGPMMICGVRMDSDRLHELESEGVRDSKTLSPKRRDRLAERVRDLASEVVVRPVLAYEIDTLRRKGVTMNEIEVRIFALIVKTLQPKEVYLDAADVKPERFGRRVGEESGLIPKGCKIISEHKADAKYPIVSAASIVAKSERDRRIKELHTEFGNFGSGYPADPVSVNYIRKLIASGEKIPHIVRQTWESVSRIKKEFEQTHLE